MELRAVRRLEPPTSIEEARSTMVESREAADILVQHLFAGETQAIAGIEYASTYHLAVGRSGGDIVDAFPLADGSISLVVADISGKGPRASVQAALVKHSLRAFASAGMSPSEALERLDRLYSETTAFERSESFVTVFVGRLSPDRRTLAYASAGHDVVAIGQPARGATLADVTGAAIGIMPAFSITERACAVSDGTLLVLATDGVTEARRGEEFFGTDGFLETVDRHADDDVRTIARSVGECALAFADGVLRDDSAILVVRVRD